MADEQYTRCPGCRTIFRVTAAQLVLREGQVRCGHCRTVFNGPEQLISLAPVIRGEPDLDVDELAAGPPTVTLRSARALDPPPPDEPPAAPAPAVNYEDRFAWNRRKAPSRFASTLYAIALPGLVILLLLQGVIHFRDTLAAHWPGSASTLRSLCAIVGCEIRPLRNVAALSIDASDLQADAAHRGLLILTATVRNRAPYAVMYPHLELTLTDAQDQAVVRRALAPGDYISGTANAATGIPANGEVPVKLFIDASATTQAGYRLYLFFP